MKENREPDTGESGLRWRRSELPYREMLEKMQLAVIEVDNAGIIRDVHEGFCKMTGYSREELIGRDGAALLLSQEERTRMRERLSERNEGRSGFYEIRLRHKTGADIWLAVGGYPIMDEQGEIVGSLGIHMDITARKKLEHLYNALNANLEEVVKIRTQEVYTLMQKVESAEEAERRRLASELHDGIGHSLLALRMELEALQAHTATLPGTSSIQEKLEEILDNCRSVSTQVRDLSHHIFPPELQYGSLEDALRTRSHYLQTRLGITPHLSCDCAGHDPEPALKALLYRIFQEAVTNALRHSKADTLEIRLRYTPRSWVLEITNPITLDTPPADKPDKGLGNVSISARLRPWGGEMRTTSIAGQSFTLHITVPHHG